MGQGKFIANNIYNVENGIGVDGGNTLIQDNYIHDMIASGSPHYDGISIDGKNSNITITHNTVINDHTQTAAIMIDNYFGPVSNVTVDNNLLYGGGYNIYSSAQFDGGSVTGVSVTNNHMGGGYWGPTAFTGNNPVYTGNVDDSAAVVATLNTSANHGNTGGSAPAAPDAPVIASFSTDSGTAGDKITNDNAIELKGSAAAGSTVKFYDGTTQIGSTTADSSGNWDYITKILTDAKHTLTATATSASGLTSAASVALAVTVDTKAPTAPTIASNTVNSANQVVMSGSAEASSVVKVFDGTTQIGTATANSSGVWNYTTSGLAAGSHSLTAKAMDAAGNTSTASTVATASISTGTSAPTTPTSPTSGTVVESAGATALVQSGGKYYLNGSTGTGPTLKDSGADFVKGSDGTWAPIAAEKTATGYEVVWKEASTGQYTAWNTDSNGNYVSHVSSLTGSAWGGSVSGTDSGVKSLETTFHQDLNGDGQIGTSTATTPTSPTSPTTPTSPSAGTQIESAGVTTLVENGGKYFLNDSTGSGPTLKNKGADFVDGSDHTWAPIAAEKTGTGYQVVWKEASTGQYTAWNTDSNGNYVSHVSSLSGSSSGGSVSGTSSGLKSLETSFHQDLNGDGQIGTSTVATSSTSTSQVVATSSSTSSNTQTSTSGNDVLVGTSKADTFSFAANFGNDVVKGFVASGPAHDTIDFSKTVFDSFASVLSHATQSGGDVVISTGSDTLTLKNIKLDSLTSHDFHFA
ncbi:hypothetical protein C7G42_29225 [Bradyrhizobium sp. MOS003]|nr:hypothetical protein C7G42_29225 [Bradyrhizobium sp. MOS003]